MTWNECPWEARAAIPAFVISGILPIVTLGWRIGGLLSPWTAIVCGWAAGATMRRACFAKGWKPSEPFPLRWTRKGVLSLATCSLLLDSFVVAEEFHGTTRTVLVLAFGLASTVAFFALAFEEQGLSRRGR